MFNQNYRSPSPGLADQKYDLTRTANFQSQQKPAKTVGGTWDALHMTKFLNRSNYSNWRGDQKNISRITKNDHKRTYSIQGDHFFKTSKEDNNMSKIGFTPIFPLVSNIGCSDSNEAPLKTFFNTNSFSDKKLREINGQPLSLQCNLNQKFKFQANALKFKSTDPITMRHEVDQNSTVSDHQKTRMNRLITRRHPHGITGIDHPQNPETQYYSFFEEKIRVRKQPNKHLTFVLDRDWKQKKHCVPPIDEWKHRKTITLRKFRNDNSHGYNILTNRKLIEQ